MSTRRRGWSGGTGARAGRTLLELRGYTKREKKVVTFTQEDSGINWHITTHTYTPHSSKGAEDDVVWRGSGGGGKNANNKQSDIEAPP
jgi:hypothetical protein